MFSKLKYWTGMLVIALVMTGATTAQACATCFGKSDSKLAEGMNWGIFTLLLVVMSVLGGISAFFVFIARRTARIERQQVKAGS